VVGLSYQDDGAENPITPAHLKFAAPARRALRIAGHTMDETLSTVESKTLVYQSRAKRLERFRAQ